MNASVLLRATDIHKTYSLRAGFMGQVVGRKVDEVRAVDGVSLELDAGQVLALVGESGSGKTTMGKMVSLVERPTAGKIEFDGEDVTHLSSSRLKALRQEVQMIFQNPYESLDPRHTIGTSVMEPLIIHRIGTKGERRDKVEEALSQVELRPASKFVDRFAQDLSGGQLQRVSIARTLVLAPRLIVADEPVSMLDVSVRSGVMNLMLNLQANLQMAYFYITHDLAVARYMSNRIAVMYLGVVVEEGPTDQLIERAAHPYTRLLIMAVPEHKVGKKRRRVQLSGEAAAIKEIPTGCRFHPRCPLAKQVCSVEEPPVVTVAPGRRAACHFAQEVFDKQELILNV